MQVYWIKFAPIAQPCAENLGVGVTAWDDEDARRLALQAFSDREVASVTVVNDVRTLDEGHVRPTMGNIFARGIWWPSGYEWAGR